MNKHFAKSNKVKVLGYLLILCCFADADDSEELAVFLFIAEEMKAVSQLLRNPATYQINNMISRGEFRPRQT